MQFAAVYAPSSQTAARLPTKMNQSNDASRKCASRSRSAETRLCWSAFPMALSRACLGKTRSLLLQNGATDAFSYRCQPHRLRFEVRELQGNIACRTVSLFKFSYVCPEPVLTTTRLLVKKGIGKKTRFSRTCYPLRFRMADHDLLQRRDKLRELPKPFTSCKAVVGGVPAPANTC
jgi:hypothetical protein